jgi:non-homologous end joining protein Ku
MSVLVDDKQRKLMSLLVDDKQRKLISVLVDDKHANNESWYFYDPTDAEVQELVTMELRGRKQNSKVTHTVCSPTKIKGG